MRQYNRNQIVSFRYQEVIKREIKIKRVYILKGKLREDYFWAEKTNWDNIIVVPERILLNKKNNHLNGFEADVKHGRYFIEEDEIVLLNAHMAYNNIGYVYIQKNVNH